MRSNCLLTLTFQNAKEKKDPTKLSSDCHTCSSTLLMKDQQQIEDYQRPGWLQQLGFCRLLMETFPPEHLCAFVGMGLGGSE